MMPALAAHGNREASCMDDSLTGRDFLTGLDNAHRPHDEELTESDSIHPILPAPEPDDAGVERSHLRSAEDVAPPAVYTRNAKDRIEAVEQFAHLIAQLTEEDYGDWMRRANMYWWHLREAVSDESGPVRRLMYEMHRVIQYCPDFRLLETQRRVVGLALQIRKALGGKGDLGVKDFGLALSTHSLPQAPPWSPMLERPQEADVEDYFQGQGVLGIHGEYGPSESER
jgi:hypothetical protein